MHVQTGCGSPSITYLLSLLANEFAVFSVLHVQVRLVLNVIYYFSAVRETLNSCFVCLFDLILYVPSTIFQLNRDGSSWVGPVLKAMINVSCSRTITQ